MKWNLGIHLIYWKNIMNTAWSGLPKLSARLKLEDNSDQNMEEINCQPSGKKHHF